MSETSLSIPRGLLVPGWEVTYESYYPACFAIYSIWNTNTTPPKPSWLFIVTGLGLINVWETGPNASRALTDRQRQPPESQENAGKDGHPIRRRWLWGMERCYGVPPSTKAFLGGWSLTPVCYQVMDIDLPLCLLKICICLFHNGQKSVLGGKEEWIAPVDF